MRSLVSALLGLVALSAGVALFPSAAHAHVHATTVYAVLEATGDEVVVDVAVEYELLASVLGLPGGRGTPEAADGAAFEPTATLAEAETAAGGYLGERLVVSRGALACEPGAPRGTSVGDRQGTAYAQLRIPYHCHSDGALRVTSTVFDAEDAVADDTTTLLSYDVDGSRGSTVLDISYPSTVIGTTSVTGQVGRFVLLGVEHLVFGLDHVLFLLALLLGARSMRDVVGVATVFTAAHSVTLILATLGWVDVPAWLVEPLIALSIAFVAMDSLLDRGESRSRTRLPVVFGFGLLHGLGFAGSLSIDATWSWPLLASLLGFNLGIEIAQVALLAVGYPCLLLLRQRSTTPAAARGVAAVTGAATVVVAGVGLFWFVDRIPLLAA